MLLEPGVGLRSSLSLPGLDAIGAMPDLGLCDQIEQRGLDRRSAQDPLGPQLAGVLEAQAAWVDPGMVGGLRHQQSDQVVRQQMHPRQCSASMPIVVLMLRRSSSTFQRRE